MRKRNRWLLALACVTLAVAVAVSFSDAFARYLEMLTGDQGFAAKPLESLRITQQWVAGEDTYSLRLTAGEQATQCRVYLALTEGVPNIENVQVELIAPNLLSEPSSEPLQEEDAGELVQATAPETLTYTAVAEPIQPDSMLGAQFGSGTVFRFVNTETGEELVFDLSQAGHIVTVYGLDSAVELTSLLRIFVENVPQ